MFAWIKTRRESGNNEGARNRNTTRRAFRPEGDRLESREVLSLFAVPGGTTARFMPGMNFGAPVNGFTGLTTNFSHLPTLSTINSALTSTNTSALVNSINSTASALSHSASVANLLGGSSFGNSLIRTGTGTTRSVPREAGLQSNVNTTLLNAGRAGGQFFPASSFPQSALSGALSGLAFTGGLGFSSPASSSNGVQNGLAFTNGSGFSLPASVFNAATNGLAFTNGSGFSTPSRTNTTASNGLAFTNGMGFSTPASVFNAATNGLSFTGGTGFTNPNTNPFIGL